MPDGRDFDYGICKIPRRDKDGNDISGDRIGKGGRHRSDGTYSGPVYDVELVGYDPSVPQTRTVYHDRPVYIEQPVYVEQKESFLEELASDLIRDYGPVLLNRLLDNAEAAFWGWWDERKERKNAARMAEAKSKRRDSLKSAAAASRSADVPFKNDRATEANAVAGLRSTTIVMPDGLDAAYEQYSVNMTSEEAQKDLLDAFVFYLLALKKLNRVANARIIDSAGNITDGRAVIEKISAPEVIDKINAILEQNPGLLETWQSVALSDILGRSLTEDARFVPIDSARFQQELLVKADKE